MNIRRLITSVLFVFILLGCRSSAPSKQISIRLTELYKPQSVERIGKKPAPDLPRTEWRFDQIESLPASEQFSETAGWEAGPGVKDLVIRNGLLTGKSTTYFPVIHLQRTAGSDDRDVLHAIEIRMRVSAGTRLSVSYENSDQIDLKKVVDQAKDFPWMMKVSLHPGRQDSDLYPERSPASYVCRHQTFIDSPH